MTHYKKLVYGFKSGVENDTIFVKDEDLEIPHGEDYNIALQELYKIQNSFIDKKSFHSFFEYEEISLWWYIFPNLVPVYKKMINFVISFQKTITEYTPEIIKIENDFTKYDLIQQICNKMNIKLEFSNIQFSKYKFKNKIRQKSQKTRFQKIFNNKTKKRKTVYSQKSQKIPNINNKYVFAIPTIYRRKFYNFQKGTSANGEYIQQPLMDLLGDEKNIVGIDIDYTFKGSFEIFEERLNESIDWIPIETLLNKKDEKKHNIFLKKYDDLLWNTNFQNLFTYDNISIWTQIKNTLVEMIYAPNIKFYLHLIDSLFSFFKDNHPKAIFLPYETGPYALSIIKAAKHHRIKTIGISHGFIAKNIPMYSHFNCETENNTLGHPIPDTTLVFGSFAKNVLIESGYPESKIQAFGNPAFFNLDKIEEKLGEKNLKLKYNVSTNQKIILFTSGKLQPYYSAHGKYDYDVQIWKSLLENFSNKEDYFIILKPHPQEKNIDIYQNLIQKNKSKNVLITHGDLFELLFLSSIVISVYSTTMIDALCFKKPVIQVKFKTETHPIPFEKYEAVLTSDINSLYDNILTLLSNDDVRKTLETNRAIFLKEQYGLPEDNPKKKLDELLAITNPHS